MQSTMCMTSVGNRPSPTLVLNLFISEENKKRVASKQTPSIRNST